MKLKNKLYIHKRNFPGALPDPVIEPRPPALKVDSLPHEPPRKPKLCVYKIN